MKDEKDNSTVDFIAPAQGRQAAHTPVRACAALPPAGWHKPKPQPKRGSAYARTVREDASGKVLDCVTTPSPAASLSKAYYVPVSFAAKDWSVTPRRIRSLLTAQRLEGRRETNGYWEVAYPYRFIIGTRGPALKRQQKPKRGRPKAELSAV